MHPSSQQKNLKWSNSKQAKTTSGVLAAGQKANRFAMASIKKLHLLLLSLRPKKQKQRRCASASKLGMPHFVTARIWRSNENLGIPKCLKI